MYYIHVEEIQMVELKVLRSTARSAMKEIVAEGPVEGLGRYIKKLGQAAFPTLDLQTAGAWLTLGIFKELGKQLKARDYKDVDERYRCQLIKVKTHSSVLFPLCLPSTNTPSGTKGEDALDGQC